MLLEARKIKIKYIFLPWQSSLELDNLCSIFMSLCAALNADKLKINSTCHSKSHGWYYYHCALSLSKVIASRLNIGYRTLHVRVPRVQMSCSDLITRKGTRTLFSPNSACPITMSTLSVQTCSVAVYTLMPELSKFCTLYSMYEDIRVVLSFVVVILIPIGSWVTLAYIL